MGWGRYHLKVTTYNTDHVVITPHSLVGIVCVCGGRYHLKVTTYNTDHASITPHSLVGIVGGGDTTLKSLPITQTTLVITPHSLVGIVGGGDTTLKSLPITQTTQLSHHIA